MRSIIGLGLLCSMAACMGDLSGSDPSTSSDDEATVGGESEKSLTASDLPSLDGKTSDVTAFAQNCVFIQWCDEPPTGGTWKVVGKVRSSCFNQCFNDAIINEFIGDAHAVCGAHSLDDNRWRIDCF